MRTAGPSSPRFDEVRATGADIMLTTCPKCVAHFECLKFEGDLDTTSKYSM